MKRTAYDIAALIARIGLGVIFIQHGWTKWQNGVEATARSFSRWGIPAPKVSAWFAIIAELGGGILLILGLATVVAGLAIFVTMAVAFVYVHVRHGILLENNGFELVVALGSAALLLAVCGAGRVSLDHLLFRRRSHEAAAEEPAAV